MFLSFRHGVLPEHTMGVTVRKRDGTKPTHRFSMDTAKLGDQWFTLEIVARDPEITYYINGKKVAHVEDVLFQPGHLTLDVALLDAVLSVRKVEIKELPPKPAPPGDAVWVPLFTGNILAGWHGDTKLWALKDGDLVASTSPR